MSLNKFAVLTLIFLVPTIAISAETEGAGFQGKWKCIKEYDGAKVIGEYMDSIEFSDKEVVFNYSGGPFHCAYSINQKYLSILDTKTSERWKLDYRWLSDGSLYLHKNQWNWRGWFTKDFSKQRSVDPKDCKNISAAISNMKEPVAKVAHPL